MLDIRPNSKGNRFRAARIERLKLLIGKCLAESPNCRILDIGGTYGFWHTWRDHIDWSTTEIVCVNLNPAHYEQGKDETRITMVQGNACRLENIGDNAFDIAFSNSVIEHVGQWPAMVDMANEVKRVARRYLVQTPHFWFPIEPHARTPFLHWMPQSWAYRVVMMRKCGFWPKATTVSQAVALVQSAQMIDYRQMAALFDGARIERERFMGLTKALVAVRD